MLKKIFHLPDFSLQIKFTVPCMIFVARNSAGSKHCIKMKLHISQTATRKRMQNQNQFSAQAQEEKRDAILNEVMPLIQNGNDPSKIRANVLDKKSDGSVIVQLTPRK